MTFNAKPTIPREFKHLAVVSFSDHEGQGVADVYAVATDNTFWIYRDYEKDPQWRQLPSLPEAPNGHYTPPATNCTHGPDFVCGLCPDSVKATIRNYPPRT